MNCQAYREIISAHIDGTLYAQEQVEVQSHLEQCPKCKQLAEWEIKATKTLKQSLSPVQPRYELKQRVLNQLGETHRSRSYGWLQIRLGWMPVLSCLLIFAAIYFAWPSRPQDDIFMDTLVHYRQATQGLVKLGHPTASTPTAALLDLTPWGYQLLGTDAHQVRGQARRVFVHRGRQEDLLVAQEVEGSKLARPPGSELLQKSGKDFVRISKDGVQLVAWEDKNVVCVLASNLPKDRIVALAEQLAVRG